MPRSVLEPLVLEAQSAIFWKVSRKEEKAVEVARSWVCSLALLHRNSSNRGSSVCKKGGRVCSKDHVVQVIR